MILIILHYIYITYIHSLLVSNASISITWHLPIGCIKLEPTPESSCLNQWHESLSYMFSGLRLPLNYGGGQFFTSRGYQKMAWTLRRSWKRRRCWSFWVQKLRPFDAARKRFRMVRDWGKPFRHVFLGCGIKHICQSGTTFCFSNGFSIWFLIHGQEIVSFVTIFETTLAITLQPFIPWYT